MAINIRNNKDINPIQIDDEKYTICQLADDTSLFVQDMQSIVSAFHIFDKFEPCSGLKVNIDKCEIIPIGS